MSTSWVPEKKVAAAGVGGGIALALVWIAQLAGVEMPFAVAEGIVLGVAFVAGWLAPHTRRRDLE